MRSAPSHERAAAGSPLSGRRNYIDWARGVAVLLMIEAHTTDAWTRADAKRTVMFRDATILGGFAAPLFLWLAGLALVLSATRNAERTGNRGAAVSAICRRGLEIFILAFLFRLQGLVITPGGDPVALFRVDVLNVMGPSMVLAGLLWGLARSSSGHAVLYAAVASLIAMMTPIVRTAAIVASLPIGLQWYIRPAGDLTVFTLFPWAAFVFAGAAAGALLSASRDDRSERRVQIFVAIAGAALIAIGFAAATRPSIYRQSSFWTSSPTWFAIRVGVLMIALSAIYAIEAISQAHSKTPGSRLYRAFVLSWQIPLARMGRGSLFIYWIHVELVYGYASSLWRQRLPLWGTAIGYVAFSALMYGALIARDWIASKRQHIGHFRDDRAVDKRAAL
jgi:uncharacterized membrane protein